MNKPLRFLQTKQIRIAAAELAATRPHPQHRSNGEESRYRHGDNPAEDSYIAIGRDWAGVHYFTDYIESLCMGEQIALGILEEQKLRHLENFTMTVPLFDGSAITI